MKVCHHRLRRKPRGVRVAYHGQQQVYYGWTGFEEFGAITPYRYFGWRVTCWAEVAAEAYGDCYDSRFFHQLVDAVAELDRLMDVAERIGRLAHEPVKYFKPPADWPRWPWPGLESLSRITVSDERAPNSPAQWRRHERRFPRDDGRPHDPKQALRFGGRLIA
jgi:hypothetical protein